MNQALTYLGTHWLAATLLVAGLVLSALFMRRRAFPLLLLGVAFGLLAAGALLVPDAWGFWIAVAAGAVLFGMALTVVTTGHWYAPLGHVIGGLLFLGVGGLWIEPVGEALTDAFRTIRGLEALQPWWLLLLLFIPLIFYFSFHSLAGLGPIRRWLAIGLRCALILFLTLALAEVRIRHQDETVTVLFVVDRTFSVPEELVADPKSPGKTIDRRWERVKKFVNDAVESRGSGHERDKAGLIVFGRRPHLELPPSDVPRFGFNEIASNLNPNYTDIAAAIKLALASFPEGTGKRIVLISDGNENLGSAEEQARMAKQNGVQIDVVPLAAGFRNENEVLVQSIEAPPYVEQSTRLPIRVLIRSYNPRIVLGTLTVKQISEGVATLVRPSPMQNVRIEPGLNSFSFDQPTSRQEGSYTYEATFQPEAVLVDGGRLRRIQAGEYRVQNKRATTHVVARGQSRVLFLEVNKGEHALLVEQLAANAKYKIHHMTIDRLPLDKGELGLFLSNYDCVMLANVPADAVNDDQQEMLRSNTYDQGCGFVMVGGPDSYGAGGWQNTPIEKALPVDCDIKSAKVQGKGGLVLLMHASEMAQGNYWQKKIAKTAVEKLSPNDEVGVLYFDWGTTKWHVPLQVIGSQRAAILGKIDSMSPGDMPDFGPGTQMAYDALIDPKRELSTKLTIIISDGDPIPPPNGLLAKMKKDKVMVTTIGVATHGAPQDQAMKAIADRTGGRFYPIKKADQLPAVYIKETRLVSQSFIHEKRFEPRLLYRGGPTEKLPESLEPLYGFVRTTPKPNPLVEMPIMTPRFADQQDFPILAYWHYGLGKSVAFTSDARKAWDRDWAQSKMYAKFWEQVVDWTLRPVESKKLAMSTEYRDGVVRIIVDARDERNRPITDLKLRAGITPPGTRSDELRKMDLKFEQKNSGQYEATFKAEEAGSYFVNAQATRTKKIVKDGKEIEIEEAEDSVRAGVTIPYSPEFSDLESNTPLMERVRDITGGISIADDPEALDRVARSGEIFRAGPALSRSLQPIWFWLVFLTGLLLFFDVAVRRIAVDPVRVTTAVTNYWEHLRGRATVAVQTPQFIERLKSRKAEVAQVFDRTRSTRRFEGESGPGSAPPGADVPAAAAPPPPRPAAPRTLGPEKEQEAADAMSRLLKAKKRIQEERDKGK